jgi:tRNA(Ile)-lysidine synthase
MGPDPAVAAVRSAVRRCLADLAPGGTVLVACSGGADSLALLAATVFEGHRTRGDRHRVVGVTVDHRLQPGSAEHAVRVADRIRELGADDARVRTVTVTRGGGPEAAARTARYAALDRAAEDAAADAVLLGHTRDDQAETVLLGLARGAGARSLAGMAPVAGRYRSPLLDLSRDDTLAACAAQGLVPWQDPHNQDAAYARVRVRHRVLPVLEGELGPGVAEALARTARLLRDDADALDALAAAAHAAAASPAAADPAAAGSEPAAGSLAVDVLLTHPPAVRRRVLRRAALEAGSPSGELFSVHVEELDRLLTRWHGQAGVDLPGRVRARRVRGRLTFGSGPVAG